MASILTNYVVLKTTHLAQNPTDTDVEVDSVTTRYLFDSESNKYTNEIEGYNLDFIGRKGCLQTVKLPIETVATIEKINEAIKSHKVVRVNFGKPDTLIGKFYARVSHNHLTKAITATADTVEITKIENDESFDFDDDSVTI